MTRLTEKQSNKNDLPSVFVLFLLFIFLVQSNGSNLYSLEFSKSLISVLDTTCNKIVVEDTIAIEWIDDSQTLSMVNGGWSCQLPYRSNGAILLKKNQLNLDSYKNGLFLVNDLGRYDYNFCSLKAKCKYYCDNEQDDSGWNFLLKKTNLGEAITFYNKKFDFSKKKNQAKYPKSDGKFMFRLYKVNMEVVLLREDTLNLPLFNEQKYGYKNVKCPIYAVLKLNNAEPIIR